MLNNRQEQKNVLEDLAFFGGLAAFDEPLHVGRPNVGDAALFLRRVGAILDRRWLTNNGPCVQEFERRVAELIGVKHCVAVCNATRGLEIVFRALGLRGEAVVPSLTFAATAHALLWQGVTPVFCDVDPRTHALDPACVEAAITERTTAIVGVHLWGEPCAVNELQEIARRRGLKLIYDAAHAFGCSHRGTMVGNFGDAEVFSFHATKFVNTFEGGAVTTNDDALAAEIRLLINFGFADYDLVVGLGTNGKMPEVSAAMGLTTLDDMERIVATNRRHHEQYRERLAQTPGVRLVTYDDGERRNYQYVVVEIEEEEAGVSRDLITDVLWAENIIARKYFFPGCHRMEPYRTLSPDAAANLSATEMLTARLMSLPTGTAVGAAQVATVCSIINFVVAHSGEVRDRLRGAGGKRPAGGSAT